MLKALSASVATIIVLTGCVTISGPSAAPSASGPSLGVSATRPPLTSSPSASAATTSQPTVSPVASPSPFNPSLPPASAPPSAAVTPGPADGDLVLFDDMDDPASGWGVGEIGNSAVSFADGNLRLSVGDAGQAIWSARRLAGPFGVLLVAGAYSITGNGGIGAACVTAESHFYGAEITTSGQLIFFSIIGGTTRVLATRNNLAVDLQQGVLQGFGIECAGLSTGALRLVAVMPGRGALGVYQDAGGPDAFIGVGMYGEASDGSATIDVEHAVGYGIPGSAVGMSADGQELLSHVSSDWTEHCVDTPSSNAATAVVSCFPQTEGAGAELAIFQRYATADEMAAGYQEIVDMFGVESEGDCAKGPHETTWSIGDEVGGRLQCAPQAVGIRFDWTDDALLILSTIFDFDGKYKNTYRLWVNAGPF